MEWRPIETAPQDGSRILGVEDGLIYQMHWEKSPMFSGHPRWELDTVIWPNESSWAYPTHWMPLPAPPTK